MLKVTRFACCVAGVASLLWMDGSRPGAAAEPILFNRDIRPILAEKCFACHGFDAKKRKADLRLDVAEGAYAANDGIQAVAPGNLAASELWRRIATDDVDEVMPPPDSRKVLSAEEKDALKRWIEQGAKYQRHWSFEAPLKPPLPVARAAGEPLGHPIDAFLDARLAKEQRTPTAEADRPTLIRRVTFDLTGLPPTADEVEAFLADKSSDAYERLVQRLLDSPRFGEHMAHYWLDIARYGDTHGLHLDNERSMWAYRDWVINAFNRNLPYDQFTIEQLAGDLLPHPTADQLTATGFSRCNVTTSEGGSIDAEFTYRYAVDRTATTIQAWMGLTAGCCVCHDHKYDPFTTKEFYALYDFFNSAADPAMDGNAILTPPFIKLATPENEQELAKLDARRRAAEAELKHVLASVKYEDPAALAPTAASEARTETVWIEDDFPPGAVTQINGGNHPLNWVTEQTGKVFSGQRAIRRSDKGVAQDFYSSGAPPLVVPAQARIFLYVYLEPAETPQAVMIQFHANGAWKHRAVWGNIDAIPYGAVNTPERFSVGPLPETGSWRRIDVDAELIGLQPSDQVTGIAFTLFGGTAYFDHLGVEGRTDPAADVTRSLLAWTKEHEGKETQGLPGDINQILKSTTSQTRAAEQSQRLRDYFLEFVCVDTRSSFDRLHAEINDLRKDRDTLDGSIPGTFVMRDLDKPRESFVMLRGAYDKFGEKIVRDVPKIMPPLANQQNPTRLDLARWLMAENHPLTARVAVNRFWQQVFGIGIVKTSGDFGSMGELPVHPELLDWLAVSFRESGWNVKELMRLLVTSAAYRRDSAAPGDAWQRDLENRLLARGPRFRLDAEEIRDNALAVSGLMCFDQGGKGVRPYQPDRIWEPVGFVGSNTANYTQDHGSALYRRSIYVFLKRTAPPPFMSNFDAPSRESFCPRRERSDTPLQSLHLLNDVQHFEAARALADHVVKQGGPTTADRVRFAYRTVLARTPTASEIAVIEAVLQKHLARYTSSPEAAKQVVRNGESAVRPDVAEPELAAWTLVANLLLNLDETVTRN